MKNQELDEVKHWEQELYKQLGQAKYENEFQKKVQATLWQGIRMIEPRTDNKLPPKTISPVRSP